MSEIPSDILAWSVGDEALSKKSIEFTTANATLAGYNLPEVPEPEAKQIFEEIQEAERIASPDLSRSGYRGGSAVRENDVLRLRGGINGTLLTAEHATDHIRTRNGIKTPKEADWGVGGLVKVLHDRKGSGALIAIGQQTSDPNNDENSWFKKLLSMAIATDRPTKIVAGIHGMRGGRFSSALDESPFDIAIGIGAEDQASEYTLEKAEKLIKIADELGLRAGINTPFMAFDENSQPKRLDDGSFETVTFAAASPRSTRAVAERAIRKKGMHTAAMQIELSAGLRLQPVDVVPDQSQRVMGVYLGYLTMAKFLDSI